MVKGIVLLDVWSGELSAEQPGNWWKKVPVERLLLLLLLVFLHQQQQDTREHGMLTPLVALVVSLLCWLKADSWPVS